jgi:uncharacterized protein with ParB-like and HNH nuclease domain
MLFVLDIIDDRCKKTEKGERYFDNCLERLKKVTFKYISLDSFKREESIYATMNGRGKQLTEFEQIKSDIFKWFKKFI